MSLQALWWRSFFSSTKQLPQPPLPLWRGRDRHRTGGCGQRRAAPSPAPPAPSSRAPAVSRVNPQAPSSAPRLYPRDPAPLSRRALGKWAELESAERAWGLSRRERAKERPRGSAGAERTAPIRINPHPFYWAGLFPTSTRCCTAQRHEPRGHPCRGAASSKNPKQRLSQCCLPFQGE